MMMSKRVELTPASIPLCLHWELTEYRAEASAVCAIDFCACRSSISSDSSKMIL